MRRKKVGKEGRFTYFAADDAYLDEAWVFGDGFGVDTSCVFSEDVCYVSRIRRTHDKLSREKWGRK